jgi:hypothetical protein
MSEPMMDTGLDAAANAAIEKAVTMLQMLSPEVRQSVLDRMDPEQRSRVELRLASMTDGAGPDVLAKRALLTETAQRMAHRRIQEADDVADRLVDPTVGIGAGASFDPTPVGAPMASPQPHAGSGAVISDPLGQLQGVHPAALARAMQGERAEAWAIVLGRVDANARHALEQYLDDTALRSILAAQQRQADLHPTLVSTIERAIARTVVPRALREQRLLFNPTSYPSGAHHHGTAV